MLCLDVRSPSSVITARRSQKSLFMELQLNILQSGFKLFPWKFKLLLGVCAKKSFHCLVLKQPPGCCRFSEREVTSTGQQWDFPLQCALGVLMELCDAMETSANAAAGEVRVFIQQSELALPHEVCSVPYTYREIRLCK